MSLDLDPHYIQKDLIAIFNASPGNDLVLLPNNPTYTIVAVTDAYLKATFTTRESIIGRGLFEVFPDNPLQVNATGVKNLKTSLNEVLQKKQLHRMAIQRYDVRNLETGIFEFKVWKPVNYPVLTSTGSISYIIHTVEDITERIQLEDSEQQIQKELKRQRHITDSILDASFNGIYALQAFRDSEGNIRDFRYLFANKATTNYLGIEPEDIIGAMMLEVLPENKNNGFFDYFCSILEGGIPVREETFFQSSRFNGWFDFSVVPIEEETLVVTINDITSQKNQLKQIEQHRNLLDNIMKYSPSGIMVTQAIRNIEGEIIDGKVILANLVAEQYLANPFEVMKENNNATTDPIVLKGPAFQDALLTLHSGKPFINHYYVEGSKKWLEISVARLDENHLISVLTDVTLIKETQMQLENSVSNLSKMNESLQQFAYAASHDLKEPIRKIHYFSDKLKLNLFGQLNESQEQLFKRMDQATVRMKNLIDDLLNYSMVGQGIDFMQELDLNEIVKQVLEDYELEIEKYKVQIVLDSLPQIRGNKNQIAQLFQNLLSNSIKYHQEHIPLKIIIQSRLLKGEFVQFPLLKKKEDLSYYLIEFIDNGIGFDQTDAERIFQVFTRLHGNAEYTGTGVGLSIAQKVVENHGGYIQAESKSGKGATFKIFLPAI